METNEAFRRPFSLLVCQSLIGEGLGECRFELAHTEGRQVTRMADVVLVTRLIDGMKMGKAMLQSYIILIMRKSITCWSVLALIRIARSTSR